MKKEKESEENDCKEGWKRREREIDIERGSQY